MSVYVGSERRKAERRAVGSRYKGDGVERRFRLERRQEAHAGVVAGLSAEDMVLLRRLWEMHEWTRQAA